MAEEIVTENEVSIVRACRVLEVHRSGYYYKRKRDDSEVIDAISKKAEHSKDGFWKIYCRLRNDGYQWNHKRVYRVYKLMNLNYRRKLKRRLPSREKETLLTPNDKNISWSMDFVSDVLTNGRRFRVLNIIDDFNREVVAMEVATSMPAERVIRILERVIWCSGKPESIRVDNGPEFIADLFKSWCNGNGINIKYIQPGKPTQNSFIERFNGSYRRGVLDAYLFDNLNQVRELTQNWMKDYNEFRPHEALGDLSPIAYLENMKKINFSDYHIFPYSDREKTAAAAFARNSDAWRRQRGRR